jgi:hypothetical protein
MKSKKAIKQPNNEKTKEGAFTKENFLKALKKATRPLSKVSNEKGKKEESGKKSI